jgi:hypothetical protein
MTRNVVIGLGLAAVVGGGCQLGAWGVHEGGMALVKHYCDPERDRAQDTEQTAKYCQDNNGQMVRHHCGPRHDPTNADHPKIVEFCTANGVTIAK